MDAMFRGEKINVTENRAVLHVALRAPKGASIRVDGKNVVPEVHAMLEKMSDFLEPRSQRPPEGPLRQTHQKCRQHRHRRFRSRSQDGLRGPQTLHRACHDVTSFVSNVDGIDFVEATHGLDPAETLFIVSSKTFTTLETMTNAETARDWLLKGLDGEPTTVANTSGSFHQCRKSVRVWNRHGQHVWVLGLGGRSLLDGFGHWTFHHAGYRAGKLSFHARGLSPHGRALPHRAV